VVMPTALFPNAPKTVQTGKTGLAPILAEEEDWAQAANRERLKSRGELAGGAGILAAALAGLFMLWSRFGRKYRATFTGDYYRDLPADYSPAELSVLWNYRKMQARDLTATIMDLARRRFLRLDEEMVEVKRLLGSKEVSTYRLTLLEPPAATSLRRPEDAVLRPHEQQVLDFLREDAGGDKGYLYLTDIEQYAKKNGPSFYSFWQEWTSTVRARGEELQFFDDKGRMPLLSVLGGLGLFVLGSMLAAKGSILGWSMIVAGTLFLFIPHLFKRRSRSGQEDYVRWRAFQRFLEHFSEMERHEIPSLIIWEHYLVYAVTLGVAKEVIKQLQVVFPNLQEGDHRFGYGWMNYGTTYTGMNALDNSFNSIDSAIDRALTSAQKAVSKSSSGSGGGGGFSGGGGGGGGGSSYGGR